MSSEATSDIAIIGMVGRFPGARDIDEFWRLLRDGREGISRLTDAELRAAGVSEQLLSDPRYVRAQGVVQGVDRFDAGFFGMSPREAEILDPQHRVFLECAWEALEHAGYNAESYKGAIGVFGGAGGGATTYLLTNLLGNRALRESVGDFQLFIANDKDSLTTRVAYKLNLRGPALTLQTACSTSLVAVCVAAQSLLSYQCDMALAGGVTVNLPVATGYLHEEGMIFSPDGHCRSFDEKAQGTVASSGVGMVVLKRMDEALEDGDTIYAVVKGAALNNDGAAKVGYTAPSVQGQARVIAQALSMAAVPPESISLVEAHGTATPVGDPIEVTALTQALRGAGRRGSCALGSVKSNIGHTDAAAGIAGLIKTALALRHRQIPPSLHYARPNPKIDFASSPFYVNTALKDWPAPADGEPRRAGVSSFGIGGTNAHVILEEAPTPAPRAASAAPHLLVLSAGSAAALDAASRNLAAHLLAHPEQDLGDVAYTLQVGRRAFEHRRALLCSDAAEAAALLTDASGRGVHTGSAAAGSPLVVFMFSGQGTEYVQMAAELYRREPTFRAQLDRCAELLRPHLGEDLREILYPPASADPARAAERLTELPIAMPAIFAVEYALAQMWIAWGLRPGAMLGLSIGEYTAACVAGVLSLEDALQLTARRGVLMAGTQAGGMLVVSLPASDVRGLFGPSGPLGTAGEGLTIAVDMGPASCAVSGPAAAVDALETALRAREVECHRLQLRVAPHSALMDPILPAFQQEVARVRLSPPQIPYLSNVSGGLVTAEEATDPRYWVRHLRMTVRLEGIQDFLRDQRAVLIEVGPGRGLAAAARRHPLRTAKQVVFPTLRHPGDAQPDLAFALGGLLQAFTAGAEVAWHKLHPRGSRRRVPLPTYPFERQRYWVEPVKYERRAAPQAVVTAHSFSRAWEHIHAAGRAQAEGQLADFASPAYRDKIRALNQLCLGYMRRALWKLGALPTPGTSAEATEILARCQIQPQYEQLLGRCLAALVGAGWLRRDGSRYAGLEALTDDTLARLHADAEEKWAEQRDWVAVVDVCGPRYAEILTGDVDPRELLFGESFFERLQSLYRDSADSRFYNGIVRALLVAAVAALPPGQKVRVLEVGAGTGSTTEYLLPVLPPQRTEYVFTDVGAFFINRAREKFSAVPFVRYDLLDLDRPVQEQGFAGNSFDVIVAANVLHATRNMGKTLAHVRSLLAPGGVLLLYEATEFPPYFDVAFPLLQQLDPDDLRRGKPFLSVAGWDAALRGRGFAQVAALPDEPSLDGHVIVAQATMAVQETAPVTAATPATPAPAARDGEARLNLRPKLRNEYVAPRTEVESNIAEVWQRCLGIDKVGVTDNFFDLGGDSLLAVQVVSQIRRAFQVELSTHTLLAHLTVELLAAHLLTHLVLPSASHEPPPYQPLVRLRDGAGPQPLFLVHAAGGHAYMYYPLAMALPVDVPIYGIQAQGVDSLSEPQHDIRAMAAQYVAAVRAVQPEGPYYLGGACLGGVVAYEMAQQLRAAGQETALLALIDAFAPGQIIAAEPDDPVMLAFMLSSGENYTSLIETLRRLPSEEQFQYVLRRGREVYEHFPDVSTAQLKQLLHVFKTLVRALWRYTPLPYPGRLTLLRAQDLAEFATVGPEETWRPYVGAGAGEAIDVRVVPGTHTTMLFPPHVTTLAGEIAAHLLAAREALTRAAASAAAAAIIDAPQTPPAAAPAPPPAPAPAPQADPDPPGS